MTASYDLVRNVARSAANAAGFMADASDQALDHALQKVASLLDLRCQAMVDANEEDLKGAADILSEAMLDRLRLDDRRLAAMAKQVRSMAALPPLERVAGSWRVPNGVEVQERRLPVGVIGAIYEARPNVTVDLACQLIKSRNAGVLRTGGASLRTAAAIVDTVLTPALSSAGLPPEAIQLVRSGGHDAAEALVSLPRLVPLVVVRGSGASTARLARLAAEHGVRTLQHAEGGGVLYVHPSADPGMALDLIQASLDRLGVCNRLNWLLIDADLWESFLPRALEALRGLGIAASLPPHEHPLSYEWALDSVHDATVTVVPVKGVQGALDLAHGQISGLAAAIVANDQRVAREFVATTAGQGRYGTRPHAGWTGTS